VVVGDWMKVKKKHKLLIFGIALLIMIVSITLYAIFNPLGGKDGVKLTLFEQRWIESNKDKIINVSIPNGVPLYSNEGKGIVFSFLEYFEKQTELEFNKIPYVLSAGANTKDNLFRIVGEDEKLKDNDLLFYNDNYVVVSKNPHQKVPLDDLDGSIGVLASDFDTVSSYLGGSKLTLTRVTDMASLVSILDNEEVSYIILPKNLYLDQIISLNYTIVNTLNDLSLRYVLTLEGDNDRLNDIITKYYKAWSKNYLVDNYNLELFNLYTTLKNVDDKSKMAFKGKRYIYGYVNNLPYENESGNHIDGISGEFIDSFTAFSGVEFNFKRFKTASELNEALTSGKVDIALNYQNLNTANTYVTIDLLFSDYVILTSDEELVIDTLKSLKGKDLYVVNGTKLSNYVTQNSNFNVRNLSDVVALKGKNIIALDNNTYSYYKNKLFKNYKIAYSSSMNENYGYVINKVSSNELFYNIFNYYLSTVNHEHYKNNGMIKALDNSISFDLSLLWLYVILFPLFIVIVVLIIRKRKKIVKVRSDVKIKYIDPLTSLKNRYYLNNNIAKWEENNIYPQAMVVINLNNLKDVNDAYGHEGGDALIKTAANILINNQMEKTDIMRTDGNEFIIYMVGYDESAVLAYVRKLYRLLKDLPYEYGASLGYSMIEDDIKTIEDAINEAILDMVTNRETRKSNEF
jgi:diguanylate cyclase (GGDEF)-like protein